MVEDDPTLVTEYFGLGVRGFDPLPHLVPLHQHQHNIQMISRYFRNI